MISTCNGNFVTKSENQTEKKLLPGNERQHFMSTMLFNRTCFILQLLLVDRISQIVTIAQAYCQAQSQLQLQLSWAEIALISSKTPTRPPPGKVVKWKGSVIFGDLDGN